MYLCCPLLRKLHSLLLFLLYILSVLSTWNLSTLEKPFFMAVHDIKVLHTPAAKGLLTGKLGRAAPIPQTISKGTPRSLWAAKSGSLQRNHHMDPEHRWRLTSGFESSIYYGAGKPHCYQICSMYVGFHLLLYLLPFGSLQNTQDL